MSVIDGRLSASQLGLCCLQLVAVSPPLRCHTDGFLPVSLMKVSNCQHDTRNKSAGTWECAAPGTRPAFSLACSTCRTLPAGWSRASLLIRHVRASYSSGTAVRPASTVQHWVAEVNVARAETHKLPQGHRTFQIYGSNSNGQPILRATLQNSVTPLN